MRIFKVVVLLHNIQGRDNRSFLSWIGLIRKAAKELAESHKEFLKECDVFVASPLVRCKQVLRVIKKELGADAQERICTALCPKEWRKNGAALSAPELYKANPGLVREGGEAAYQALEGIARESDSKKAALVICQNGPADACLVHVKKQMGLLISFRDIHALEHGHGYVLFFRLKKDKKYQNEPPELFKVKMIPPINRESAKPAKHVMA